MSTGVEVAVVAVVAVASGSGESVLACVAAVVLEPAASSSPVEVVAGALVHAVVGSRSGVSAHAGDAIASHARTVRERMVNGSNDRGAEATGSTRPEGHGSRATIPWAKAENASE